MSKPSLSRKDEIIALSTRADRMRRTFILLFASLAAASPLAAGAQEPPVMQPTEAMRASSPRIEVVRVKRIDPAAPQLLRFQLGEGSVDVMKAFSLGGSDGIGGVWKIPPHIALPGTFDARWGEW
jgi:hypothetical protein